MATACTQTITLLYIYYYVWRLDLRLNNINYSCWYFSSSVNHHILILNPWVSILFVIDKYKYCTHSHHPFELDQKSINWHSCIWHSAVLSLSEPLPPHYHLEESKVQITILFPFLPIILWVERQTIYGTISSLLFLMLTLVLAKDLHSHQF